MPRERRCEPSRRLPQTERHPRPRSAHIEDAMTAAAGQRQRLRGERCLCTTCGHLFGSPSAFDRHLAPSDDPRVCLDVSEFTHPTGKARRPRLVWSPHKQLWVTRLDNRDHKAQA